jgi:hypothetical protein
LSSFWESSGSISVPSESELDADDVPKASMAARRTSGSTQPLLPRDNNIAEMIKGGLGMRFIPKATFLREPAVSGGIFDETGKSVNPAFEPSSGTVFSCRTVENVLKTFGLCESAPAVPQARNS